MTGRRGGRTQVTKIEFMGLEARVARLEKMLETTREMTKNEVMEVLDAQEIKYNPRDKKEVLMDLLPPKEGE